MVIIKPITPGDSRNSRRKRKKKKEANTQKKYFHIHLSYILTFTRVRTLSLIHTITPKSHYTPTHKYKSYEAAKKNIRKKSNFLTNYKGHENIPSQITQVNPISIQHRLDLNDQQTLYLQTTGST